MNYYPLEEFKYAWVFRHQSLPLDEEHKSQIKPMVKARANVLWDTFISKQVDHADFFKIGDWPFDDNNWLSKIQWEPRWDSEESQLPEEIIEHLDWDLNTTVYFCINRDMIIETNWRNFKDCWKNFLFMDDGSILIGKKRSQAVQFFSDGSCQLGNKPN